MGLWHQSCSSFITPVLGCRVNVEKKCSNVAEAFALVGSSDLILLGRVLQP